MKQDRRSTRLSAAQKKKLIIIIAAAAVLITAAVVILRKSVSEKYGKKDDTEILYADVTRGSISTSVSGSGQLSVDESEILSVSVGQSAIVTIDSINGEVFNGTVTEIDRAGTSSSGVTTYTATISIDKTDAMLAGMSASATIVIDGVDGALLIPVDALNKTSSSYYVYTSYDENSGEFGGMVEVTVGISNANYVEITGGLNEGDTVYYKEQQTASGFMPGGMDFGGGGMPSGDFGGAMPSGDFGGGNMPSGGPGGAPGGRN